ncbi:UNVERIFIED_ORG: hypothetical protein M2414_005273 [Rahnella aquatilis]
MMTSEYLTQRVTIPIKRHTKIRCEATLYDPAFASYWRSRKEHRDKSCLEMAGQKQCDDFRISDTTGHYPDKTAYQNPL